MISYIWIKTQKENFHFWNEASEDIGFLKNRHRHLFYFKVYIEVLHNNREIEFFQFKKFIEDKLESKRLWEDMSCEMISDWLFKIINFEYPKRKIIIEVSEDNENGSKKEY